jgi:uncharacterized spore protein YtfJ
MTTAEEAMEEGRRKAEGSMTDRLVERLVDRIGSRAGVKAVFGEPIERAGVTVIPVARVRWFAGAGAGTGPVERDQEGAMAGGSGGGGGATATPVGYIEIGSSGATFKTIAEAYPSPLFLLAAGVTAAILLRGVRRLFRG